MTTHNRESLHGKVQTVTGLISPDELGQTLMHEHLLIDLTPPALKANPPAGQETEITLHNCWQINYGQKKFLDNYWLNDEQLAIEEMNAMQAAGGRSLVELTVGGLKPDPEGLRRIATGSGANIIVGCGHYVEKYQAPANHERSIDDFAQEMIDQIYVGAWGTDVRAGIIGEIGCQSPWTELERRVMQGALLAQQETGASLNVHPGRDPDQPQEVIEAIRGLGYPVERVIISHIDRTIFDEERLLRLADTGCIIEFDMFGWEVNAYPAGDIDLPNDGGRVQMVKALTSRGFASQVLISHDICVRTRMQRFGGHGYQHIYANILPLMQRRGISEQQIHTMLVDNPKRLLTFGA